MAVLDSDAVDVWILGFDLAPEDAAEGIAWAFEMDLERAAALVASVPRLVRRSVTAAEAAEAAEALGRAGADVALFPEGHVPARLEDVSGSVASPGGAARGPRVTFKKVSVASLEGTSASQGDEPAYGEGSSAYVPMTRLTARGPARRPPVGVAPPVAVDTGGAAHGDDSRDDDELVLGSLIPAPMRAPAPASLRPPRPPSSAPPAARDVPPQASREDTDTAAATPAGDGDLEALQAALASLPKVKASSRSGVATRPSTGSAPAPPVTPPPASSPLRPQPTAAKGRATWVLALGGLAVVGGLIALGRSMSSDGPPLDATANGAGPGESGMTDAQLLASTVGDASEDARTWLRLDERNHFGDLSASESRVFLERLWSTGALSANVGLPADASGRASVLVLQHSPLHRAGLLEAATVHPAGRVVPAACVNVGQRYMVIRFDTCE